MPRKITWEPGNPKYKPYRGYRARLKEARAEELISRDRMINGPEMTLDEFGREILTNPPYTDPDPPKPFRKRNFIKIFRQHFLATAIKDLLTISEYRVLLFILAKCSFNNEFIYHNKDIAFELNLTFPTVSRTLKKLVNLGYISKSHEFIGYQVYSRLSWKGSEEEYSIQRRLEVLLDAQESYARTQRGEIDKYGYELPPEEINRKKLEQQARETALEDAFRRSEGTG